MSMKEYEKIDLSLERLVICVVSTTGQGDPPDNASKFFKFIKGRSNAPTMLAAWRFCVLGLGDTNYDMFCKPGKVLDKRLEELGAQRFVTGATGLKGEHGGPNGAADDAEGGQEECIEPWVKHLLSTMDKTGAFAAKEAAAAAPVPAEGAASGAASNGAELAATPAAEAGAPSQVLADGIARTLVLFGSQTGNAESVAGRIKRDISGKGGGCTLMSMKEYEKIDLSLERLVICVVSTTGQGDPPDNASKFFKFIKGRSNAPTMLAAWRFCVLGLGDTNYDMFCKPGKVLDKRLEELGAQRFVTGATGLKGEHGGPNGAADDAEGGQEECIEPWVKHLLSTMDMTGYTGPASKRARVENACTAPPDTAPPPPAQIASTTAANQASAGSLNEPSLVALPSEKLHMFQDVTGAWKQVAGLEGILKAKYGLLPKPTTPCMCLGDADPALKTRDGGAACDSLQPRFLALITAWRYLTTPASTDRVVVEVEFDVSQGDWAYAPGDSIGIDCCNSLADVDALLSHLGYDPLHRVTVSGSQSDAAGKGAGPPQHLVSDGAVTLRDLVAWRVDIRSQPKKALIRLLADHCGVEAEADDLYLLSSIKGRDRFRAEIEEESVSIIELLKRYPSARPPLAVLLQVMSYFTFFCCCFLLMVELLTRCTPPARTLFCFSRGH